MSAAAVAVAGRPLAAALPPAAEEQTEFTVILTDFGANKVERDQGRARTHRPGPEGSQGPGRRRTEAGQGRRNKADAEAAKKKLEEAGAKAEIK